MLLALLALLACGASETLDAPAAPPSWPLENLLAETPNGGEGADAPVEAPPADAAPAEEPLPEVAHPADATPSPPATDPKPTTEPDAPTPG